ncbi:cold-shock protein [Priestia megaterium]|uniref:cold-shock protein n=1 Tax=Priestia megaterium TaxID=1404 RepID=UPI00210169ED|nr:cold shock domain-containing protein [Priestia megaterium]
MEVKIETVKWFNPEKGFGVISSDKEGEEVIVYFSSIFNADYLHVGQKVSYIERQSSSGFQAEYVVIL